jgi:hypothetical protein
MPHSFSINYFYYALLITLSVGCGRGIGKFGSARHAALSHQAIFYQINAKSCHFWDSMGEKIYFHQMLLHRPGTERNKYLGFGKEAFPELLFDHYPNISIALVIPDSLSSVYKYYDGKMDLEKDISMCSWFSPLLPTKKKGIYALQEYNAGFYLAPDSFEKDGTNRKHRLGTRRYDLFTIKGGKLKFLKEIHDEGDEYADP